MLVVVFVFPGHEHGWFCVRVGHDAVLVVRVLGFSFGVVHMRMWCSESSAVCIVWVRPPSPPLDHPPGSSRATLSKSTCVVC